MKKAYFALACLILLAGLSAPAQAAYTFKMGHSQATDHAFHGIVEHFVNVVKEKSNGEIDIVIFASSQLGDEQTMMDSLKMGTLDFLMANASNVASHVPEMGLISCCFLFNDKEHIARVSADPAVFERYSDIITKKKLGFTLLSMMGNGARHLYTIDPVKSLDDIAKKKIRIMPSAIDNKMWAALGAVPTTVAFNEVYTALQTHMVDGAENTFSSYYASKHFEVAGNLALTEHQWLMVQFWVSNKTLAKLPDNLRAVLFEAAAETAPWALEYQNKVDENFRKELEASGKVTIHAIDRAPLQERIAPLQDQIAKDLGTEDILARIRELAS